VRRSNSVYVCRIMQHGGGTELTPHEQHQLKRYRDLLKGALRSVSLSANELYLIWEAVQDTIIDASTARHMVHDLVVGVRMRKLDDVYSVDMPLLCRKLASYNDLQRMAILDALEQVELLLPQLPMLQALAAVGLISEPSDVHETSSNTITAWIAQTNSLVDTTLRGQARPPAPLLVAHDLIAPNILVGWAGGWAYWDADQQYWSLADWHTLGKRYPMLASQLVQVAEQAQGFDPQQLATDLIELGNHVFYPKARYQLDETMYLVARWDGENTWWFDLPTTSEQVLTVEEESGILWMEMRAQLGMGTRHRWSYGLYTIADLRPLA
jgi:hypothetical protein